ncbi:MAG: DUF2652 domain-containing protein [Saprospiraceae bacterium]|nr:DUF2652 domain-containing protein [Saprospiraceae bacterium]
MTSPSSSRKAQRNDQKALIFIPDISGFTEFVHNTEIHHAQHIIEELLEVLIDTNEIGLEVSEIEGDAILFYRFGKAPTAAELLAQIQRMYVNFQAHIRRYETHRICQCGACSATHKLSLKFVAHFGPITMNNVKEHSKLFGKDVIVAHRLLKNDVKDPEYALFTHSLVRACETWVELPTVAWANVDQGSGEYDYGTTKYCSLSLSPLQMHVPEPKVEDYALPGTPKMIMESEGVINAPINMVFDVLSDLSFRHRWQLPLVGSDKLNSKITKNGSTHRCVIKGDDSDPLIVSHDFKKKGNVITFTDTSQRSGFVSVFTLRELGPQLTRAHVSTFARGNVIKLLIYHLFMKKKSIELMDKSWKNLNDYCRKLMSEGRDHDSQIVLLDANVA